MWYVVGRKGDIIITSRAVKRAFGTEKHVILTPRDRAVNVVNYINRKAYDITDVVKFFEEHVGNKDIVKIRESERVVEFYVTDFPLETSTKTVEETVAVNVEGYTLNFRVTWEVTRVLRASGRVEERKPEKPLSAYYYGKIDIDGYTVVIQHFGYNADVTVKVKPDGTLSKEELLEILAKAEAEARKVPEQLKSARINLARLSAFVYGLGPRAFSPYRVNVGIYRFPVQNILTAYNSILPRAVRIASIAGKKLGFRDVDVNADIGFPEPDKTVEDEEVTRRAREVLGITNDARSIKEHEIRMPLPQLLITKYADYVVQAQYLEAETVFPVYYVYVKRSELAPHVLKVSEEGVIEEFSIGEFKPVLTDESRRIALAYATAAIPEYGDSMVKRRSKTHMLLLYASGRAEPTGRIKVNVPLHSMV